MAERFRSHVAVYVFLINDGKVLLMRRAGKTGYENGNLGVPAGHLDGKETLRQAAVREAKEEAGVDIDVNDLAFVHLSHRNNWEFEREYVDCFFIAQKWEGEPFIAEPHKCSELGWFDLNNLPEDIIPVDKRALQAIAEGRTYEEFGW